MAHEILVSAQGPFLVLRLRVWGQGLTIRSIVCRSRLKKPKNLEFGLWVIQTFDFFYLLMMTQGYQLDHLLFPYVLPLSVHLDVEGVILTQFYSLSFVIQGLLHA